jgi:protein SCO1
MPTRVVLALLALAACAAAAMVGVGLGRAAREPALSTQGYAGAIRPPGATAPDVALRDQDGAPSSLAAFRGRPVVVTFLYSTCRDTCPAQVQTIRGALDDLGRDVPVVGVSVDPAGDTAERARRFVRRMRMTGRMTYLLGDRPALTRVWRAFGIRPKSADLEHSAYVVLVDGRGRQRIGFPSHELTQAGLAHDLARLTGARD